ncbi:DUF1329 domain-containing protein [Alkalimarinus sediminis]|uniref:DUF1329 domain-containing protein n=1 Tax=Alkalimarinus sediminis TaxID=1632866 RepID=A0A9E8HF34_9ALTE|nr:DUF1329 domain-containing protein [Alkalimarinus sediminis]UZW73470.1 DUF1329 domain-containing protein [Alkalimarinus sediminis]
MKLRKRILAGGVITLSLLASAVSAKVSDAEAAKLGAELTPIGAEKAGNAAGTIPEWTGGYTNVPAGYVSGTRLPNPFPDDKPLFTINKDNMDQYKDNMSPGQVAMMTKYPDYIIPVYQTRRTAAYPQAIYDGAKANATTVEMIEGGNGLTPFQVSIPFPIPQNGLEVIWNHITRYRGGSVRRTIGQATPLANGNYSIVQFLDEITWRTSLKDYDPNVDPNVLFYFKQVIQAPTRLAGNVLLAHETIDQVKEPRRAWVYNAGQRRVRRAPQVAYDGPGTASDGLRTSDNFDMYNGSPDRYNWKLVGKKELYIPYNSYKLDSTDLTYDQIIKPGHINQELTRYELHRVWVVEATLKDGQRHIYAKRTFFIDEDTWQATVIDHYDGRGELWRVAEAHNMSFYGELVPWYTVETLYDLLSGRYLVNGLNNEQDESYVFNLERSSKDYTPAALRRAGKR